MVRVYIYPEFSGPDNGDGIRRVVEAQKAYLPQFGVEVVPQEAMADVVMAHAGSYVHTSKPYVTCCHGLYWTPEYTWSQIAHDLNRRVINNLRRCDVVTAPSEWVAYSLQRAMNLDAQVIYHGIDAEQWQPGAKQHPYVLWNKSRVDPICDPHPVDQIAPVLPGVDFVTTFSSDPGNVPSNMRVTGRLPFETMKSLVQNATVYLATARETFGIGTLEAMASGAVVVGYAWGGQAEIITDGKDGILVPPGNTAALARAVQEVLDHPEKYAENARATAATYTWERACKHYAQACKDAVDSVPTTRVSVVVSCYNLGHVLERAVDSVRQQPVDDWEVVIVNDASPDDTASVAAGLESSDPRIRVVTNETNLYLAGSLDAGIKAATGRYIVPLDADNELGPNTLALLADALDTNPDVDVAYGAMKVVEERFDAGSNNAPATGRVFVSGWPGDFSYLHQMSHRNQIPSTSMYRRKWWERADGYRRRCRTAEDADFWCRITSLGAQPKKVTSEVTLVYHDRTDSMSHVEREWPWANWYTWGRVPSLMPYGAPSSDVKIVPTYEPSAVTVVIPVGPGHDKFLADALDSLVGQTYQNWRCIVVDDRGADTPLVAPPWAFVVNQCQPNGGPAHARNIGLSDVRTPYVLFLDADDYLTPNALEVLLSTAMARGGTRVNEWYYSDWHKQEDGKVYQAPDFDAEHIRTHLTHSVTALYPMNLLNLVGGFDESLDAWEDWDLILRLITETGACGVHVPYPLFYYRYHTGNRRELLYKDRLRHVEVMKDKWRKYMVEGAEMPCGCQGGRTSYTPPVLLGNTPIPVSKDGSTLVEFVGRSAPRTWRGRSGREYRFGSSEGHKMHPVLNEDLQTFIYHKDFRVVQTNPDGLAVLEAAGPPDREAEYAQPPPVLV